MPSDALAKLLEAASAKKPDCSCDPQLAHTENCLWVAWATARISAPLKLEALAPALADELIEKRSAGQAMADGIEAMHRESKAFPFGGEMGVELRMQTILSLQRRADEWNSLGETEVRDG